MPISIKFNERIIGSIDGCQTKTMEITEKTGTLTYEQPLDRTDQIEVKDGDVVALKETTLNKTLNIFFLIMITYLITKSIYTLFTGLVIYNNASLILDIIIISVTLLLFVISIFFNSYKFVIVMRKHI